MDIKLKIKEVPVGKTIGSNFNITPPDIGIGLSKQHKTTKYLGFAAFAATCASLAAFSSGVYADTVGSGSQEVGGRLAPNSVTVSTDGNVSIDIVRSANPTLAVGKGTVTVTAGSGGYQLYISGTNIGSNGYTSLYYDGDINSSSKIEGFNVNTPSAFTSAHANQWGYAVASEIAAETGFSTTSAYNSILATGATVDTPTINNLKWKGINSSYKPIRVTSSTASPNNTTDVYYGIYTNSADLMAGNYKNSVIYTAFVDGANTLNITPFAVDNGNIMTITAEYQSSQFPVSDASRISVNLRDGDTSVGTCNNINIINSGSSDLLKFTCQANITDVAASSKVLDASVTVKMPNSNSELNYTAEDSWSYYASMNGKTTMQEAATTNACATVGKYSVTGITYSLKDTRTDKWYLVRKLEDGNCWMAQNLWLDEDKTYIGSNGTGTFNTNDSSNLGWIYNSTVGTQFYAGTHSDSTPDSTSNTGSFFTWKKATADTGGGYGQSGTVTNSVCPQGWSLPSGGSGGDFDKLYTTAYSGNKDNLNAAWSGAFIGFCGASCGNLRDLDSYWWASTQSSIRYGDTMSIDLNSSAFYPAGGYDKGNGSSVRCMLSGN